MANHYIEKYGKQLIREVLDIILIAEGRVSNEKMRDLLIEHDIIKKSTKMIRSRYHQGGLITHDGIYVDGRYQRVQLDEPYRNIQFWCHNGRNQQVFSIVLKSNKIGELLEELENDTTTD